MRVVVSGGGTGGHIFPALAVCEGLLRADPKSELLYIGSISGMESEIVPKTGIPYQAVAAKKVRKLVSFSTIGAALSLVRGYREARTYLRAFKADAVVGTGGYVAAAAAMAGASLKLPIVILAPDSVPGRTNRMLARFARKICVVFAETVSQFPAEKTVVTGLPLRTGIVLPAQVGKSQARCSFPDLRPDLFTVLVIGGSQGARALNGAIVAALPDLIAQGAQVLHQTGPKNIDAVTSQVEALGLHTPAPYCPSPFFDEGSIALAYRAADLIVCRGGISTISEVTANGLPAVIVPLPTAFADHQTANARALERQGAAICLPESDLSADSLATIILDLKAAQERLNQIGHASSTFGSPNSSDRIAELILGL